MKNRLKDVFGTGHDVEDPAKVTDAKFRLLRRYMAEISNLHEILEVVTHDIDALLMKIKSLNL